MAAASAVAVVAAFAVPAATVSAWNENETLTATSYMAGTRPRPTELPPYPHSAGTTVSEVAWTYENATDWDNHSSICVTFDATAAAAPWAVYLDLDDAPLWGWQTNFWSAGQQLTRSEDGDKLVFTGQGTSVTGQMICTNTQTNPPVAAGRFTAAQTPWVWTPGRSCSTLTVTAKAEQDDPFYFGWSETVDLTDAYAQFTSHGGEPYNLIMGELGRYFTADGWSRDKPSISLVSTFQGALRKGSPGRVLPICLEGSAGTG